MEEYREWAAAALVRAVKTSAQTAVSLIGTGAVGFTDLDWLQVASVSGEAAVVSVLTSEAGLPEVAGGKSPLAATKDESAAEGAAADAKRAKED